MSQQLNRAHAALNDLTPDELAEARDNASALLALYHQGGVLTGRGTIEIKKIPYKVRFKQPDGNYAQEKRIGFYAYIRRGQINEAGKVTVKSVGYYGKGGAEAVEAGRGDELLAAHLSGGEPAGDVWLMKNGYEAPLRRQPPKPPADHPIHPLGNEAITADTLTSSPIFAYFQGTCGAVADQLLADVRAFEADLREYNFANEHGLRFRLPQEERQRRRITGQRKNVGTPPQTVRRKRRD